MSGEDIRRQGPGPFITHLVRPHPRGGHEVATSRRHRKGLFPHRVRDHAQADRPRPSHARAFLHLWAPRRIAWWIALLFAIGASLFAVGSASTAWPDLAPLPLRASEHLAAVFFVGSLFFTTAAWLQWIEALNGDVTTAFDTAEPKPWRWFGWLPHNLGYLASAVQLAGTLLFNINTADGALTQLSWIHEDLLVWTPNMLGSVCFLVASLLALVEVTQGSFAMEPRSISWWVAVINLLGSIAFQVSAVYSVATPAPSPVSDVFWASSYTLVGAVCFFVGAYLMIPELFDEADGAQCGQTPGGGSPGFHSIVGRSDPV